MPEPYDTAQQVLDQRIPCLRAEVEAHVGAYTHPDQQTGGDMLATCSCCCMQITPAAAAAVRKLGNIFYLCMHPLKLTFWGCPGTQAMRMDQKDAHVRVPAGQPSDSADCRGRVASGGV